MKQVQCGRRNWSVSLVPRGHRPGQQHHAVRLRHGKQPALDHGCEHAHHAVCLQLARLGDAATFPSTLAEYYAYDLVGNLLSKTDRKGNTIQYLYDALYRLTQKTYPDTTNVEYAYDLANKVLQVSDPTGTYGFAYDNMGRLISTTANYTFVTGTYTNSYTYDAASNRTSLTAPDGSISTYGYDTLNRLNSLANSWAGSFGFGYDALSRRTQLTRSERRKYELQLRLAVAPAERAASGGSKHAGWCELHL